MNDSEEHWGESATVSTVIDVVAGVSAVVLAFYVYVIAVIVLNFKRLNHPFYACVISLAVADFIELSTLISGNAYYVLWETKAGTKVSAVLEVFLLLDSYTNMFALSIVRFAAIVFFKSYDDALGWKLVKVCIPSAWAFILFWAILYAADVLGYWEYDPVFGYYPNMYPWAMYILFACQVFCVAATTIMHLFMFAVAVKARKAQNERSSSKQKKEYRILLQSSVISVTMVVSSISVIGLFISATESATFVYMNYVAAVFYYGCNPFLYVIFSPDVRRLVLCNANAIAPTTVGPHRSTRSTNQQPVSVAHA